VFDGPAGTEGRRGEKREREEKEGGGRVVARREERSEETAEEERRRAIEGIKRSLLDNVRKSFEVGLETTEK